MNASTIPVELRERRQWVLWRLVDRDGKATKVPYRADGSGNASSTDPNTWASFEAAVAGAEALAADGIGYVFAPNDPFVGVDLDTFDADAAAIVAALDSYTETSVSGRGAHVIVRASLNGHPRNRKGPLEVYDHGRYFVVTGNHVTGTPTTIEERQEQLEQVLARFLPKPAKAESPARAAVSVSLDDRELLNRATGARNGADFAALYAGTWEGRYPSQSEADLALCSRLAFWTDRNPDAIDRLFRTSGLYRPKWDRNDYRDATIGEAIAGCRETYARSPRETRGDSPIVSRGVPAEALVRRLTATPMTDITMRSIRWLEKPLWQTSAFQLLSGAKGAGKGTYIAGLAARISRTGANVLIVSSEDSAEIDTKPRLAAAGADMARCFVVPQHPRLPDDVGELRELALDLGGVGLFVLDPIANHIGTRNSNSDAEVRDAIAPLNGLADDLACLLIGVRHPGKDRSRGALASILGSTAWVDTPRAVVMIAVDDEDEALRHIQVVAGNRSLNGSAQAFRIEAVDVPGLAEPITRAVELGASAKSVDELLAASSKNEGGRVTADTIQAVILQALETGEKSRAHLDEVCGDELDVSADTVYRRGLAPLKEAGQIEPRKAGTTGGWYWRKVDE